MDWNRLLQGVGGRLLRQAIGVLMKEGINRMSGSGKPKRDMTPEERARHARSSESQKRLGQIMKVGRRFWR
jgi:hypothetical protein